MLKKHNLDLKTTYFKRNATILIGSTVIDSIEVGASADSVSFKIPKNKLKLRPQAFSKFFVAHPETHCIEDADSFYISVSISSIPYYLKGIRLSIDSSLTYEKL